MMTELSMKAGIEEEDVYRIATADRPTKRQHETEEPTVDERRVVDLHPEVPEFIESMAFSANSQRLLAMGRAGQYVLYSVRNPSAKAISGRSRKLPAIIHALSALGDDDTCLIGGANPGFVSPNRSLLALWNLREDREVFRYESSCGDIQQIESDGDQIVVAGAGGWVEVFESGDPRPRQRLRVASGLFRKGKISLSRGGRFASVATSRQGILWDVHNGSQVASFEAVFHKRRGLKPGHRRTVQVAVPTADGSSLLLGGGDRWRTEYEAKRMQAGTTGAVGGLVGSLVGSAQLANESTRPLTGEAVIWDVTTGALGGYLPGSGMETFDGIVGAKFIDANRVVLVNDSGHIIFWDRKRDSASIREGGYAYFQKLIVSPNDKFVAVQTSENTVRLLRTPWWKRGESEDGS
jgi:WD40 repeat protein